MSAEFFKNELSAILDESFIKIDEPMSRHTTFRVGGNAKFMAMPQNVKQVSEIIKTARKHGIEYVVLGNGSNVVVSDNGFNGIVIKTSRMNSIKINNKTVTAQCGASLALIGKKAMDKSLNGFECLSGIPGTVGGAVVMNAGAYGSEIKDVLVSATVLTKEGEVLNVSKEELSLSYRNSSVVSNEWVILSAIFELSTGNKIKISERMKELKMRRLSSQPLNLPNAGSVFKRIEGNPVGAIIENAGLKNTRIGGAVVSEKHANFIVNTGNATASDIITLIDVVKRTVKSKTNIDLNTEIKIIDINLNM